MHPPRLAAPLALLLGVVYAAAACQPDAGHDRFAPAHRDGAPPDEALRAAPDAADAASSAPAKNNNDFERFTSPSRPSTRHTLAHILESESRIGAFLGLPEGWINDDPSYTLFFPRGREPKPPARAVAMTLAEHGISAVNEERLLTRGAEPAGIRNASWQAWQSGAVGAKHFAAAIALGTGESVRATEGERVAIAAIIDIAGAPALGFMGSWAKSAPQHQEEILEMLRAIERCQVEVGRGCVGDDEGHTFPRFAGGS